MNKNIEIKKEHSLTLVSRKRLTLTAVADVLSFDENSMLMLTDMGVLSVDGEGLHIITMSVDSGDIVIEGNIASLSYTDKTTVKSGLFGKKRSKS